MIDNSNVKADAFDGGIAGDILIRGATAVNLVNDSEVSSITDAFFADDVFFADGGTITIEATDGSILIDDTNVKADAFDGGIAGDILIRGATAVNLVNDSEVSSITDAFFADDVFFADGGTITIEATDGSILIDDTNVTTNASNGVAGNILIDASGEIIIQNSSEVSSNGNGGIILIGTDIGNGTDIDNLPSIDFIPFTRITISNSQISTNASNGVAGDILIGDSGEIIIRDSSLSSDGKEGEISIGVSIGDLLSRFSIDELQSVGIEDLLNIDFGSSTRITISNSEVTTTNEVINGLESAGDIFIVADKFIKIDQGNIFATTTGPGQGGDIGLQTLDGVIILRRDSFINVEATDAASVMNDTASMMNNEGGNAGSIFIDTDFLIASPGGNNDIIANARVGDGGRVEIDAISILGFTEQRGFTTDDLRANRINDLSASSEFGVEGEIILNTPDIEPDRGLNELPTDVTDRADQIVASCGLGNTAAQSRFVVSGRSGLPPSPNDAISAEGVTVPWVAYDDGAPTAVVAPPEMEGDDPIVEAQGMIVDADGNVSFVADVDAYTATNQLSSLPNYGLCAASSEQ